MNMTSPKKKRIKKALERKHKDPLPITVANDSFTWTQYVLNALYTLIGWQSTEERHFKGDYSREGRCICISDKSNIQEIYCKGFFGKGNLSRSEPTWSQRVAAEGTGTLPSK
jgi:tRNA-splicing endonuclease subunit Sen2